MRSLPKTNRLTAVLMFIASLSFLLASCGRKEPLTPLPEGLQTISGVLNKTGLSPVRRGTHVIIIEGIAVYLVESSKVDLHQYEGQMVSLKGALERNTDPKSLPVLVVEEVLASENDLMKWKFSEFAMEMETPSLWEAARSGETIQFFSEGSEKPVLTIYMESGKESLEGFPVIIGGTQALRKIDDSTGAEYLYVARGAGVINFIMNPQSVSDPNELKTEWLKVLRSIKFGKSSAGADEPGPSPLNSTGSGLFCGGSAGILCPPGYYCDVKDMEENIGVCERAF